MAGKRKTAWRAAAANVAGMLGVDHADVHSHAMKLHRADKADRARKAATGPVTVTAKPTATPTRKQLAKALAAPRSEVKLMTSDSVAPALQRTWLEQRQHSRQLAAKASKKAAKYAMTQDGRTVMLAAAPGDGQAPEFAAVVDPERAALDREARKLAKSEGIDYVSACEVIESQVAANQMREQDGSHVAPHLDTSRPMDVEPWNDTHWERDQRRAAAAGVDVDKALWQAGGEQGRDIVAELADQKRQGMVADHDARTAGMLQTAKRLGQAAQAQAKAQARIERGRARAARQKTDSQSALHDGRGTPDFLSW